MCSVCDWHRRHRRGLGDRALIAGPRAGVFAAAALAVCGPGSASMFNHTKDIPFAAAMMGATYFLLRAARAAASAPARPDPVRPATGAALGQRAMGLLLPVYALLAIVLHVPRPLAARTAARFVARSLVLFVPAFALGYLIMIAAWPWAALSLINPIRAVFAFVAFRLPDQDAAVRRDLPRWAAPRAYVPVYLAIKMPLVVLLGAVLAPLAMSVPRVSDAATAIDCAHARRAFIAITAALPVIIQVVWPGPGVHRHAAFRVSRAAARGACRHRLRCALAWLAARRRALAHAALAGIGAWYLWTASVLVRLHPYEYFYFNEIVGGLAGAYATLRHGLLGQCHARGRDRTGTRPRPRKPAGSGPYFVAVCGERLPFENEALARGRLKWATRCRSRRFLHRPDPHELRQRHRRQDDRHDRADGRAVGVVKDRRTLTRTTAVDRR